MKNLRIAFKLALGFGVVLALMVLVGLFAKSRGRDGKPCNGGGAPGTYRERRGAGGSGGHDGSAAVRPYGEGGLSSGGAEKHGDPPEKARRSQGHGGCQRVHSAKRSRSKGLEGGEDLRGFPGCHDADSGDSPELAGGGRECGKPLHVGS